MKKENLKMIVFDMDGVLLDSEPLHEEARQMMYKKYGLVKDENFPEPVGMAMKMFWSMVIERFGIEGSGAELEAENYGLVAQLVKERQMKPSDGLMEILEWAKENDIMVGVASSSGKVLVDAALEQLGIRGWFDCIVTGDDVQNRKPDPEPYQKALQICKVQPKYAAAVEDSRSGLLAAKTAGMFAFGYANPTSGAQNLDCADKIVNSLKEIVPFMEKAEDKTEKKLKAVIFDLDGVITDSAKYHYLAWKALADRFEIPFDETYNEKLKGVSRMESLELVLESGNMNDYFTDKGKIAFAEQKNNYYKELIWQITPADILPGIEELLKELKAEEIRIILASASKNAPFILNRLGLEGYFDYVVDAAQIENAKPAPDVFLAGRDQFGFSSDECIGVEDAKAGVEAIHRAGMKAVGVGTPDQMKEADLITTTDKLTLAMIREQFRMI